MKHNPFHSVSKGYYLGYTSAKIPHLHLLASYLNFKVQFKTLKILYLIEKKTEFHLG